MIRLPVPAVVLLAALAGCSSSGVDPDRTASKADAADAGSGMRAVARPGIASAPDDGDLARYDSVRRIQPSGAYTSYPVTLSEAHAYHALAGGELVLTAPDGEILRLQPQRHEEYTDGNWTLAAADSAGNRSLLTFGQDAVFGSVTRADGSTLRITTRGRQVYIVSADPTLLAALDHAGASTRSDMLLPPVRSMSAGASHATASSQVEAQSAEVTIAAANDLDVLLGYTPGLVARIGSESGAVTRMQNLVAIANEAYGSSGVTMRLRLVRSMLVNYTDSNTNQAALQSLTGSSGSGSVPVDAAFNAIRAAREETGADLVSLVRQFREPENDGCGIAWILGGSQTAITQSDASFGYSVISDGSDVRESDGRTYICRDETLAHELGHNMGQVHNVEDSKTTSGATLFGAHAYSFGYRETGTTSTDFFTIMAYRVTDSSQIGIRYFANPAVTYAGRPTGTASTNDNVRSMNLTMPIIAGFRASTSGGGSVPRDINGDGRSDLVWHNANGGRTGYWLMNGATPTSTRDLPVAIGYRIAATGDFNGDGRLDLLWTSNANDLWMWPGNASGTFGSVSLGYAASGWQVVGSGDVNGDGRSDLLWHNATTGRFGYWLMNGATATQTREFPVALGYRIATTGDFNGDGRLDLVWTSNSNDLWLWPGNTSGTFGSTYITSYGGGWQVAGSGDVNADGRTDLVWHNATTSRLGYWLMNGAAATQTREFSVASGYRLAGYGDFNGDSRLDLLWTSNANDLWMWPGNTSGTFGSASMGYIASGWQIHYNPRQP